MAARQRFSPPIAFALPLALALAAASTGCEIHEIAAGPAAPQTPAVAAKAEVRRTADVVAAALPAVVLLINERPGATPTAAPSTTFGAGFLTRDGLVVTSLHVVDGPGKLSAMLYKAGRKGYTPMDGGLSRYLFENQADLVPAERIAGDTLTDLAVLRVRADTSHLPALVWSQEEARPGDRVLALGHPQETVWSFSEGVVGALQFGIVQHDAIVGPGSSGGPLLNEKGEVIGVNVARVMNQPTGLSFARPIALLASTFGDKKVASPLDLSTPASAALACWRAQEMALSDTADCFDWEREWEQFKQLSEEARRQATTSAVRDKIDSCYLSPQAKPVWVARQREHVIHLLDTGYEKPGYPTHKPAPGDGDAHGPKASPPAEGSLSADFADPKRLATRLRNGLRVESTHFVSEDLAWVLIATRGGDGAVSQFTELYARTRGKWLQWMSPTSEEVAQLPAGWPEPPLNYSLKRPMRIAGLLHQAATMTLCPFSPGDTAAASGGGSSRAVLRPGFSADL